MPTDTTMTRPERSSVDRAHARRCGEDTVSCPRTLPTRLAGLACVAATAWLLVAPASATAEQPGVERTITVVGKGSVSVTPDKARLSVAVVTRAKRADTAAEENARATDAVLSALEKLIGPDDELRTGRYSLGADYDYVNRAGQRERKLVGYTASNSVIVTTAVLDTVGKLIDAAVAAGANEINGLEFLLSDEADARRRAIAAAGALALAEADSIAKSLGVRRGALLEASTAESSPPPRPMMRMAMAAESAGADTPIAPGSIEVTARVNAVFAIE